MDLTPDEASSVLQAFRNYLERNDVPETVIDNPNTTLFIFSEIESEVGRIFEEHMNILVEEYQDFLEENERNIN